MAENPSIVVKNGIATINGKTYSFLSGYKHSGDWFWIAVAGKTRLDPFDLADYWRVVRSGNVYIAFAARPFSYNMALGSNELDVPDDWPKFKSPPEFYALVGPTEEAAQEQLRLLVEARGGKFDQALNKATWINNVISGQPRALTVRATNI